MRGKIGCQPFCQFSKYSREHFLLLIKDKISMALASISHKNAVNLGLSRIISIYHIILLPHGVFVSRYKKAAEKSDNK